MWRIAISDPMDEAIDSEADDLLIRGHRVGECASGDD